MNAEEKKDLRQKINAGVKAAVAAALEEHRRAGRLVAIWKNGRVCIVLPEMPSPEAAMMLRDNPNET
jgi:hypothetical protein